MSQPNRSPDTDERGAVFVEKLIVILPLLFIFFATWELAEVAAAKFVVERACSAASRAAMVVLPDDPQFYDGEPVGSYGGKRRDDIELSAGMVLSAIPQLGSDFAVDVSQPTGSLGTIDVSLTAPYGCGIGSIYCLGAGSIDLTAEVKAAYHGAKYEYGAARVLGRSSAALTGRGGSKAALRSRDSTSESRGNSAKTNGNGKRPRECDQCDDPTAHIKNKPSLTKKCTRVVPDEPPVYSYKDNGPNTCPVTAVHLSDDGDVTYCFKQYATSKSKKSGGRNQGVADGSIAGKVHRSCPAGTKFSVKYEPASAGGTDSARVDLTPFAAGDSKVLIPATVSGTERANNDDGADFKYSWAQFRKRRPGKPGMTQAEFKKQYDGYTWHHDKVVKIGNLYYYEMILVPTTIHETAPHAGGSAWIRAAGITQTPAVAADAYTPPTGPRVDLLQPRRGKPPNC